MPMSDAGRELIAAALTGDTISPYNNANTYLGVGDSAAAFSASQTSLQGAQQDLKPMDASYPLRLGAAISFRAVFDTADANFAWNEWGVFNALEDGTMLNRRVESLGTKDNTQTWQLTVNLTVVG